jgi:hypothetical protein
MVEIFFVAWIINWSDEINSEWITFFAWIMDNYSIYFDLIKSDLQSDWIKPDLFLDNTLSDRVKSAWIII